MNLKQLFYRDYYHFLLTGEDKHGRPLIDQRKLDQANRNLLRYKFEPENFDLLDLAKENKLDRQVQKFNLITTYPGLFTGSGYTHETGNEGEFKLGFFFDHATGLPLIPGHSVKGTLRSVFPQFKSSSADMLVPVVPDDDVQKNKAAFIANLFSLEKNDHTIVHQLELSIFAGIDLLATKEARATARQKGQQEVEKIVERLSPSQHDQFLDAFIAQSHNPGNKILGSDAITPHGDNPLRNPIPLSFIKVLPNVEFTFPFILHDTFLSQEADSVTVKTKREAFENILLHIGIGAKTNVGYGQFNLPADKDLDKRPIDISGGTGIQNLPSQGRSKEQSLEEIQKNLAYDKLKSDERFGRVLDAKAKRNGDFPNTKRLYFLPDGKEFPHFRDDELNQYERKTILKVKIVKNPLNSNEIESIAILQQLYP